MVDASSWCVGFFNNECALTTIVDDVSLISIPLSLSLSLSLSFPIFYLTDRTAPFCIAAFVPRTVNQVVLISVVFLQHQ
ncbi:hypothetical protein BT96DRAFT_419067 [Gymnopus androsaceus JB14]|uniref:Uncharacterized protein n=1 Tax=Gymnopus androsaceus JB14 TaxID=1447944 RepID=A0A6A4I6U0_9AGAR|nr:hypothetical protein BT96DRAFT_419067 [Gymnopus androsaceus JB14]